VLNLTIVVFLGHFTTLVEIILYQCRFLTPNLIPTALEIRNRPIFLGFVRDFFDKKEGVSIFILRYIFYRYHVKLVRYVDFVFSYENFIVQSEYIITKIH